MRTNAAIVQQPVGQSPWDLTGDQPSPKPLPCFIAPPTQARPSIGSLSAARANAIPRRTTERSRLTHWQTPQFRNRTWPEHDGCAHNGRSAADRGIRIHCLALGGVDLTSAAGCANQATAGRSAPAIEWRGKRGKPRETLRHAPPNDHAGSRFDQVARNLVVRASNHLVKLDQTKQTASDRPEAPILPWPGKINNRQATSSRRGAGCRNSASLRGSGPHSRRSRSCGTMRTSRSIPVSDNSYSTLGDTLRNRDGAPGRHVRVVVTYASTSAASPRACACRFRRGAAAVHAERVDDTERPTTSGVREHLPPQPVIVVSQAVAHGLRISEKFVSIQLSGSQYHACTFFHTRPCTARLRATQSSAG